jgi:hypothetical protein
MTSDLHTIQVTAPWWWWKFWKMVSWAVCEALYLLDIPLFGKAGEDYGHVGEVWCCHVHSALETVDYQIELQTQAALNMNTETACGPTDVRVFTIDLSQAGGKA